jgi:hypothetical protein
MNRGGGVKVPESCRHWADLLRKAGGVCLAMIQNIERDACVPTDVAATFFERVAARPVPKSAAEAAEAAKAVVREGQSDFTLRGPAASPQLFAVLCRVEQGSSLWKIIPREDRPEFESRLQRRMGISLNDNLKGLDPGILPDVEAFIRESGVVVQLGYSLGVVWVTAEEAQKTHGADMRKLVDLLGLASYEDEDVAILIIYPRRDLPTAPTVPTVLDALDFPRFRPSEDPKAEAGRTWPLSVVDRQTLRPEDGLPEAVHPKVRFKPPQFLLRSLP